MPILLMVSVNPRIEQIEQAFSVETVTDEFFEQYKALYRKLADHLKTQPMFRRAGESETEEEVSRFAKKLLGQIVFLYFLQKKGWLGAPEGGKWKDGSKRFLRYLFDHAIESGVNYYSDVLCYLFYEALACERKAQEDSGYYERFGRRVPFLNGGLFEAGDYDWRNSSLDIPDSFFHNEEKSKGGDTGTGILDVFDRYNFTIREDEPLDKEVAVDPEMLGKVFEKMLSDGERKGKGAFYTPREIVHYMCQESLVQYLDNRINAIPTGYEELGLSQISMFADNAPSGQMAMTIEHQGIRVPKKDMETLIRNGYLFVQNDEVAMAALHRVEQGDQKTTKHTLELPNTVRIHARDIDAALADIKVCDPAIGSGAFPVGMLHEIVVARQALAHHTGNTNSSYALKRHAIAENIYGVDIDASAIDIARLRLWLSLIVDEEDYDTIEPLPNLDYKIIQGDSLIGIDIDPLFNKKLLDAIEDKKKAFFDTTDHDKKEALGKEIDTLIHEITNAKKHFDFRVYFSEVWHLKNGFDVVIGNPPYVQIQSFSGQAVQNDWERQKYETFAKTGDMYCLFYEKGYRLLRKHGVLAFITSNKWMRAAYGEKLRQFFLDKVSIDRLIDFGDSPIFSEATTYTNILLFKKSRIRHDLKTWDLSTAYRKVTSLPSMLEENEAGTPLFTFDGYVIVSPEMALIKQRIEAVGTPLKDWNINIYRGILTGFNEAFIIDEKKRAELIAADPRSAEIIKPVLRGRDIKRYRIDYADLWLIATFPALNINIDDYPAVCEYLKSFGAKLNQTGEVVGRNENGEIIKSRKQTGNKWFETQDQIAYYGEFSKEKIVWLEMSPEPNFAFIKNEIYILNTSYILTGKHLKWLLPILDSELLNGYFPMITTDVRGKTRRYIKQYVENLPVVAYQENYAYIFEALSDYVHVIKLFGQKFLSTFFEQLIDGLVYELYFPEELKAAGKELQPHIGNLTPLADDMPEEQKLAIIQQEFDRLSDPSHPIRQRLDTLDEVEVVQTVRAALKR